MSPTMMEGVEETADPWVVMVNPVVTPVTDEVELGWERCLSIPGLHGKVPRHQRVGVTYQTLSGEEVSDEGADAHALLLQHECDHPDGVLYPMRMTDLSRLEFDAEPGHLVPCTEARIGLSRRRAPARWPAPRVVAEDRSCRRSTPS
jgi:peptide deformylase